MQTAFISHPDCAAHDTGAHHPEAPRRLSAITDRLVAVGLAPYLRFEDAPLASAEELLRVHDGRYLEWLEASLPRAGHALLDPDTVVSPASWRAALRAAGAAVGAVDLVLDGEAATAFCAVRPPGHHAEPDRAMGFCLLDNVAVAAAHALAAHGLERVAVLDFDAHHGNGTERAFQDEPRVLLCSSFQHPFYPHTPVLPDAPNRVSTPLPAGAGGDAFRAAVAERWLPALARFRPELVLVSAGFDGHRDDDLSGLSLRDEDYAWVSAAIMDVAGRSAGGRVVSVLEGGYDLPSLARCAELHLRALMGLA